MATESDTISLNMCRLCLRVGEAVLPLYTDNKLNQISDTIMTCTLIKINLNDGLPAQICNICSTRLHDCFEFKQQCEQSDNCLRSKLNCLNNTIIINSKVESIKPCYKRDKKKLSSQIILRLPEFINVKPECYSHVDLPEDNDSDSDVAESHSVKKEEADHISSTKTCNTDNINITDMNDIISKQGDTKELKEYKFKCEICNEDFVKQKELKLHMSEHIGKFICKICSRKFISSAGYQSHIQAHKKDNAETTCSTCGKEFRSHRYLMKHKIIHTGKQRMSCSICGKLFSNNANLKRHMMIHEGRRPFVCHICGYSFNQAVALNLHVSAIHTTEKAHLCNKCGKRFKNTRNLERHVSFRHSDGLGKKPYTCDICSKVLSTKQTLKYHLNTHTENPMKPFLCVECGNSFKTKYRLEVHERSHTGEKPFACSFCPKKFSQHSGLKVHTYTHTGEKPYSCKVCNKYFTQVNHVKEHMLTHSGEKNHVCDVCNHRFALKGNLKAHMMTHTGETPFICTVCSKGFYVAYKLKHHMKKVHSV